MRVASTIPLGRAGTVDEAAAVIVSLISDQSSYVHGAILDVSGGRRRRRSRRSARSNRWALSIESLSCKIVDTSPDWQCENRTAWRRSGAAYPLGRRSMPVEADTSCEFSARQAKRSDYIQNLAHPKAPAGQKSAI